MQLLDDPLHGVMKCEVSEEFDLSERWLGHASCAKFQKSTLKTRGKNEDPTMQWLDGSLNISLEEATF